MAEKMTVLLVDDDVMYQKVARELIEQLGHECVVAPNGTRALKLYQIVRPDAVLMDMALPAMNATEAAAALTAKYAHAQVVFISSLDKFPAGTPPEIVEELQIREKPWTLVHMRALFDTLTPCAARQQAD